MVVLRWAILICGSLWALSTNLTLRSYYKTSNRPQTPVNTFAMIQTTAVIGVIMLHRSAFHLLWLFPLSYLAGFFTLRYRALAFVPWLYGQAISYTNLSLSNVVVEFYTQATASIPRCVVFGGIFIWGVIDAVLTFRDWRANGAPLWLSTYGFCGSLFWFLIFVGAVAIIWEWSVRWFRGPTRN
jgi:hypothetical protein